jgi:hypothetical protein
LLLACSGLCGCVTHEARIAAPAHPPAGAHVVIGTHPYVGKFPDLITSPEPIELPITAYATSDQGLLRCNAVIRTPLVWWQRFPCDIPLDLLPVHPKASAEITLEYHLVTPQDASSPSALAAAALAHGYAHKQPTRP